ncbi:hypothetical protein B1F74_00065, partial [Pseudomonas syringae]
HPNPRSAPSPRQRRGRSKTLAPSVRKPCLLAPKGEGRLSGEQSPQSQPLHRNLSRSDATTGKMRRWMSLICSII